MNGLYKIDLFLAADVAMEEYRKTVRDNVRAYKKLKRNGALESVAKSCLKSALYWNKELIRLKEAKEYLRSL